MAYDWVALGANIQNGINNVSQMAQGIIGARTALQNMKNQQTSAAQTAAMNQAQINAQNLQNAQAAQNLAAQQAAALNPQSKQPAGGMSTTTMLMIGGGLVAVLGLFWVLKK